MGQCHCAVGKELDQDGATELHCAIQWSIIDLARIISLLAISAPSTRSKPGPEDYDEHLLEATAGVSFSGLARIASRFCSSLVQAFRIRDQKWPKDGWSAIVFTMANRFLAAS